MTAINKIPDWINPTALANRNMILSGKLPVKQLQRLTDLIASHETQVEFELLFSHDYEKRACVSGTIKGELKLTCQRCMKEMLYPLDIKVHLIVVHSENQAKELSDNDEPLLVHDSEIELKTIIEDELLLDLPVVPKHEQEDCKLLS